jgi:hypothetical protein
MDEVDTKRQQHRTQSIAQSKSSLLEPAFTMKFILSITLAALAVLTVASPVAEPAAEPGVIQGEENTLPVLSISNAFCADAGDAIQTAS